MKWGGKDEEGRLRLFGIPVSPVWQGDSNAILDSFEPENPKLLVARKYGLGWDINLGAVAVKTGWIRPDDSLPDLADHVPPSLAKALRVAPIVAGVATIASALLLSKKDMVATGWSLSGLPRKFSSGKAAALIPITLTALAAAVPHLIQRDDAESPQAVRISAQADLLGVQAMSLAAMAASLRTARHPERRQFLAFLAPALWPVVAGGLQIACVKTALQRVNAELHATTSEKGSLN